MTSLDQFGDSLIQAEDVTATPDKLSWHKDLDADYLNFLHKFNGGFTPNRLFHFFGTSGPPNHDLSYWNALSSWKKFFGLDDKFFVFCEDVLGNQYGFLESRRPGLIKMLSPITGRLTTCPATFQGFLDYYVNDPPRESLGVLEAFSELVGSTPGQYVHLSHKIPPCLGGAVHDPSNLEVIDSLANLQISGQVLSQVQQLAPGTSITDVKIDLESRTVTLITDLET